MKTVTVRQIPPALARAIEERARRRHSSVTRPFSLARRAAGLVGHKSAPARHHDLDELASTWTRREAKEF